MPTLDQADEFQDHSCLLVHPIVESFGSIPMVWVDFEELSCTTSYHHIPNQESVLFPR